jgi:hypothetical protein
MAIKTHAVRDRINLFNKKKSSGIICVHFQREALTCIDRSSNEADASSMSMSQTRLKGLLLLFHFPSFKNDRLSLVQSQANHHTNDEKENRSPCFSSS